MDQGNDGADLVAKVCMGACAAVLAVAHYARWNDPAGDMLFGIALLILLVGTFRK